MSASPSASPSATLSPSATPSPIPGEPLFYEGKLVETPEITKSSPDDYWGIDEPDDISIQLNNVSGIFTTKMLAEEWRNRPVRFWSWDETQPEGSRRVFESYGRIKSYNRADILELTVSPALKEKLQADYPQRVYKVSDWPEERPYIYNPDKDLGKPYSLCFGKCEKVYLIYVHRDGISKISDYIVGYGPLKGVTAVWRGKLKVPSNEYTFYDGTQSSPYAGFAFIRFQKPADAPNDRSEQRNSVTNDLYDLYADVDGFTYGQAIECRNFVNNIRYFLSDTTWGLSEKVNELSFNNAAAAMDAIGQYYHDGQVDEQRQCRDILNDMLMACRAKIRLNVDGEWEIFLDAADSEIKKYFGSGDGKWENLKAENIDGYYTTSVDELLRKVTLKYKHNAWENEYAFSYDRAVFEFGEDVEYVNPFIRDHTTADKFISYLQKRAIYRDPHLNLTVGKEGFYLKEMDLVHVTVPRMQIDSDFKVRKITKTLLECSLELIGHNNEIFVYTPATTINVDAAPIDAITYPDFQYPDAPNYVKPPPPVNPRGLEWTFIVGPGGTVTARLLGAANKDPQDLNFKKISVGVRDYDPTDTQPYLWKDMFQYSTGSDTKFIGPFGYTDEWRIYLDFEASKYPGDGDWQGGGGEYKYFDAAVKSVNVHGHESEWILFPYEQIAYKPEAPEDIVELTQTLVGQDCYWAWNTNNQSDFQDYHIQIADNEEFSSPLFDSFVKDTSNRFLTSLSVGAAIFCRVRSRNTTWIESWNWNTIAGFVGESGSGGGGGIVSLTLPVCALESVIAGRFVNIYATQDSVTCVRHATASVIGREAHGFVLENADAGQMVTVYLPGAVNTMATNAECVGSLTPAIGGYAYLSDNPDNWGTYSYSPPVLPGHFVQKLGLPIVE